MQLAQRRKSHKARCASQQRLWNEPKQVCVSCFRKQQRAKHGEKQASGQDNDDQKYKETYALHGAEADLAALASASEWQTGSSLRGKSHTHHDKRHRFAFARRKEASSSRKPIQCNQASLTQYCTLTQITHPRDRQISITACARQTQVDSYFWLPPITTESCYHTHQFPIALLLALPIVPWLKTASSSSGGCASYEPKTVAFS